MCSLELDVILNKSKVLNEVSECVKNNIRLSLSCLEIGEKALTIYYLHKRCVVVCSDVVSMNMLKNELSTLGMKVGELNAGYIMPVFAYKQENLSMCEFLTSLYDFYLGKTDVLLVLPEALFQLLPQKSFFDKKLTYIAMQDYNFADMSQHLTQLGYTRCERVSKRGEFCIHGDIVDIFALNSNDPIKLNFFGDNLEQMYFFDIDTFEKKEDIKQFDIYPATIYLFDENKQKIINKFNEEINKKINDNYLRYSEIKLHYENKFENNFIEISDSFILPFFGFTDNVISLFQKDLIIFNEPKKIFDDLYKIYENNNLSINNLINDNELLFSHKQYYYDIKNKTYEVL